MERTLLKAWGIEPLNFIESKRIQEINQQLSESINFVNKKQIIKLPLHFTYLPVQILSKQLTKLNSKYQQRIIYLGPRWNDSFQWHKKFSNPHPPASQQNQINLYKNGYYFNQKRVLRNNSFIHDSMRQNRFFKNQVYYRAFQGMNPTVDDQEVVFQSRFESGNLDCVVKIKENQYDLFLRIDTNTRGHIFWYYFTINLSKNSKTQNRKIKLNICNITKSKTLYQRNFKPYVKRNKHEQPCQNPIQNWNQGQGITNCKFRQRRLKYPFIYEKIKPSTLYELSFQIQLKFNQETSLAYCIPYTYSFLTSEISKLKSQIKQNDIQNISISKLGQSLTGIQIPIIIIGDVRDIQNSNDKKVVFITGRTHPGQSNSSLILNSLINQLCLKKREQALQNGVIFIIIPMLNPDGVILGNGRCSALGKDLNRQFKSWNAFLNSQVVAIKKLIEKVQEYYEVQMYFDFHGHSKKKNIFFFGPNYSVMDPNYYRCRVFPKILSKNLQFFRYYGCSYTISETKNTTARAVMLNQFNVPFFYTVQTSVGFFHDYTKRQIVPFNKNHFFKIGLKFKQSLKQYFEGIQEYETFLKGKKKQKLTKSDFVSTIIKPLVQKDNDNKNLAQQQKLPTLKFIKVFQEIKTQVKNVQKTKKQQNSETDSDSCRASQQLETQKAKQFSSMLINFNKIQENKLRSNERGLVSQSLQMQKRRQLKKKKIKHHSEVNDQILSLIKKVTIKYEPQFRIHPKTARIQLSKSLRKKDVNQIVNQVSQQEQNLILKPQPKLFKMSPIKQINQLNISAHNFFRRNDMQFQIEGGNQPMGFVNFSKAIQNPKLPRYSQQGRSYRISSKSQKRKNVNSSFQTEKQKTNNNLAKYFFPFSQQHDQFLSGDIGDSVNKAFNGQSALKPYPSSFYRIKYQTSHKKYRDKTPNPIIEALRKKSQKSQNSPKKEQKIGKKQLFREPQKLFINISKMTN